MSNNFSKDGKRNMQNFIEEVKKIPTDELIIIIEDQEELYSKEEFEILKKEFLSRKENGEKISKGDILIKKVIENALDEKMKKENEKEERKVLRLLERAKKEKEMKLNQLKENGFEEYCEYKVLTVSDAGSGVLDVFSLEESLNKYALEGWRVKTSYTNELGKNSNMVGFGGFSTSTNSTIDEHIIILERVIKIK